MLDRQNPELCKPLSAAEKAGMLRRHWFTGYMAAGLGRSRALFEEALALGQHVPMLRVGAPPGLGREGWADAVAALIARAIFML